MRTEHQILSLHLGTKWDLAITGNVSLLLLVAALVEIKVDRWSFSLPILGVHLAVLSSLLWVVGTEIPAELAWL